MDGVYDSGVRSRIYIGDGCKRNLQWIQFMLTHSGRCYRGTQNVSTAGMVEPQGMGVMMEQMLSTLVEDHQRREQELHEERE